MRPPFRTSFEEPTRRPTEGTHLAQQMRIPPELYHTPRTYEGSSALPPIIGPNGTLYYPARSRICFHCQEEGHFRPQCARLHNPRVRTVTLGPEHPDTRRESAPTGSRSRSVSVVEVAAKSSVLNGMRVCEVTAAGEDSVDLKEFVHKVEASVKGGYSSRDYSDNEEDGIPVMAGEKARRFSELPPEFDGQAGPSTQRRIEEKSDHDGIAQGRPGKRKIKPAVSRVTRRPIRMMAGWEKFDFVGAFRDAPVTGLSWGSFFDLAPSVKKDISTY